MWYMIIGEDYPDSLKNRGAARDVHLARIAVLNADGRVLAAGPLSRSSASYLKRFAHSSGNDRDRNSGSVPGLRSLIPPFDR